MLSFVSSVFRKIPYVLLSTIIGAMLFIWIQVLNDNKDIATFIGSAIAQQGGYKETFANPIGYSLHLAISFSYAMGMAILLSLPFVPQKSPARLVIGFVGALLIGWIATMVADPAISITISYLAGNGWPEKVFPLHTKLDLALVNHIVFFVVAWLLIDLIPNLVGKPFGSDSRDESAGLTPGRSGAS